MKRSQVFTAVLIYFITTLVLPSYAIKTADHPIPGPDAIHEWGHLEFMYEGEEDAVSLWNNAFCNEKWTGITWTAVIEDGIPCIAVRAVDEGGYGFMDFNYYKTDNDKYYPSLDCSYYKYLKVKYKLNSYAAANAGPSSFFVSSDADKLGSQGAVANIRFDMTVKSEKWVEQIIDLSQIKFSDGSRWEDKSIRQFRYYPFGTGAMPYEATCHIEYIAFFPTLEKAEAYMGPYAENNAETDPLPSDQSQSSAQTSDLVPVSSAVILISSASLLILKKYHTKITISHS